MFFFIPACFLLLSSVSVEQQEPEYYSKNTTFGEMQYTAYLQRLDVRDTWKISRLLGQNTQELLPTQNTGQILLNTGLLPGHYHIKSEEEKMFKAHRTK